ncbi:ATP-binding protein [Dehalogenimonas sp. 4OHTPN]|uniref:histidine kinase n=1 Tax=Dehalogenimonas sp. 4OHTPN TaxID=3166643 RepID=A0AAU8GAP7_9CHLR
MDEYLNDDEAKELVSDASLRERPDFHRALYNMSSEPMLVSRRVRPPSDISRRVIEVNEAFLRMTGLAKDEVIGKSVERVLGITSQTLVKYGIEIENKGEITIPTTLRTKTGHELSIEIHVSKFEFDTKNLHFAIIHDVEKHIETQKRIKHLLEKEHRAKKRLEKETASRSHFTRLLVHELKTQLTPMISASDALTVGLKDEPWITLALQLNQSCCDLNNRVEELIDLAKGEVGLLKLDPQFVDIADLMNSVIDFAQPHASKNKQRLKLTIDQSLLGKRIKLDKDRFKQIVINLVSNSMKYTPDNGAIVLKVGQDGGYLVARVIDSGCGISRARLDHMYEPYYQEDSSHLSKGLGIGLFLSNMIAKLHGGDIKISSIEKRGTVCRIRIPMEVG